MRTAAALVALVAVMAAWSALVLTRGRWVVELGTTSTPRRAAKQSARGGGLHRITATAVVLLLGLSAVVVLDARPADASHGVSTVSHRWSFSGCARVAGTYNQCSTGSSFVAPWPGGGATTFAVGTILVGSDTRFALVSSTKAVTKSVGEVIACYQHDGEAVRRLSMHGSTATTMDFTDFGAGSIHTPDAFWGAVQAPGTTANPIGTIKVWFAWGATSGTAAPASCPADPGAAPPSVVGAVDAPALYCNRELRTAGGEWYVDVRASVLNPDAHAVDAVSIKLPWETSARVGAEALGVPLPALSTMPEGGWKGTCAVKRTAVSVPSGQTVTMVPPTASVEDCTVDAFGNGSGSDTCGDWKLDGQLETSDCALASGEPDWSCMTANYDVDKSYATPVGAPSLSPWITTYAGGSAAGAAAAQAAGVTVTAGGAATAGGVVAGAAALAVGALYVADEAGVVDWIPDGCGLFERLGQIFSDDGCPAPTELDPGVALRQQQLFLDAAGNPITKSQLATATWATAHAVAEVLINPARPEAGKETVTVLATPRTPVSGEPAVDTFPTQDALPTPEESGAMECDLRLTWNPVEWVLRPVKCALRWAFVPKQSWTDVWGDLGEQFPFSVAAEVVTAGDRVHAAATSGVDGGAACPVIDVRNILEAGGGAEAGEGRWTNLLYRLPTPEEANCGSWNGTLVRSEAENRLTDVFGYRELVRNVALFFLLLGFALAVIRAFVDEDPSALEPDA